uniref:Uncharacterized protein n=1 Tax=Timema bartmani TaxID=61472 RepID=A0A7R9EY46_9NEOP|nr:unnamed protein product [Timema bartmani]
MSPYTGSIPHNGDQQRLSHFIGNLNLLVPCSDKNQRVWNTGKGSGGGRRGVQRESMLTEDSAVTTNGTSTCTNKENPPVLNMSLQFLISEESGTGKLIISIKESAKFKYSRNVSG